MINKEINELLSQTKAVHRHSYFQLKYFLIGKEPTHQSKLWRCITELQARKDTIETILLEIDESNDRKALLDIDIEQISIFNDDMPQHHLNKKEIHIRQLNRKKTALDKSILSLETKLVEASEEAQFFYEAFKNLEAVEKLKPFDDLESQTEFWNETFSQELQMKMLMGCPPDFQLIKSILCLKNDVEVKEKVLGLIDRQKKALTNG